MDLVFQVLQAIRTLIAVSKALSNTAWQQLLQTGLFTFVAQPMKD